jgi:hypothetical protein
MECKDLYKNIPLVTTLVGVIDIPGILLNGFSVICIIQIIMHNSEANSTGNMFKYLLVKSFCEFALFAIDVFYLRYDCASCGMANTLAGEIWNNYFASFIEICLMYVSSMLEVVVSLDCYLSIRNRWKFMRTKTMFYVMTIGSIAFSVIYHIYYLYGWVVVEVNVRRVLNETTANGTSLTYYEYQYFKTASTSFAKTDVLKFFSLFHTIFRDVIILFLILVLNVLILIEMRRVTKFRLMLAQDHSDDDHHVKKNHSVLTALRAERKRCIMVLLTGLVYGCGHVGNAVTNAHWHFFRTNLHVWYCLQFAANQLLMFSYAIPFILYYFFNSQFKRFANQSILLLLYPITVTLKRAKAISSRK